MSLFGVPSGHTPFGTAGVGGSRDSYLPCVLAPVVPPTLDGDGVVKCRGDVCFEPPPFEVSDTPRLRPLPTGVPGPSTTPSASSLPSLSCFAVPICSCICDAWGMDPPSASLDRAGEDVVSFFLREAAATLGEVEEPLFGEPSPICFFGWEGVMYMSPSSAGSRAVDPPRPLPASPYRSEDATAGTWIVLKLSSPPCIPAALVPSSPPTCCCPTDPDPAADAALPSTTAGAGTALWAGLLLEATALTARAALGPAP